MLSNKDLENATHSLKSIAWTALWNDNKIYGFSERLKNEKFEPQFRFWSLDGHAKYGRRFRIVSGQDTEISRVMILGTVIYGPRLICHFAKIQICLFYIFDLRVSLKQLWIKKRIKRENWKISEEIFLAGQKRSWMTQTF